MQSNSLLPVVGCIAGSPGARRRRTNHPVPELAVCTARLVGRGWGAPHFIWRGGHGRPSLRMPNSVKDPCIGPRAEL